MALLGALNVGTIAVNAVLDTASLSSGMKSVQTSMDSLSQKIANGLNKMASTSTSSSAKVVSSMNSAKNSTESFAESVTKSLNKMAEVAGGVLIRDAVRGMVDFGKDIISDAFNAYAAYERLQKSLEFLIKTQIEYNVVTIKSKVTGQEVTHLTAKQSEKLQQLKLDYEQLGLKIKESQLHHADLVKRYGEEGIATKKLASEITEMQVKYQKMGGQIASLQGQEGKVVNTVQKFRELAISEEDAQKLAMQEAKNLMQWVQNKAIFSPYNEEDVQNVLQTASSYGFMSQAVKDIAVKTQGLNKEQADNIVTIEELTSSIIDYGSAAGRTGNQMYLVVKGLADIKTKGVLRGEEARQLGNLIPLYQILSDKFNVTQAELIDMQRAGKITAEDTIGAVIEWMHKFDGAAKDLAFTWYGLQSTVEEVKNILLRTLFGGVFQAIQPYVEEFVKYIVTPEFLDGVQAAGVKIGEGFAKILKIAEEIIRVFSADNLDDAIKELGFTPANSIIIKGIIEFIKTFSDLLKNDFAIAGSIVKGIMAAFMVVIVALAPYAKELAAAIHAIIASFAVAILVGGTLSLVFSLILNPINLLIAAVALLAYAWNNNWLGIKDKLKPIIDTIVSSILLIPTNISNAIKIFNSLDKNLSPGVKAAAVIHTALAGILPEELVSKIADNAKTLFTKIEVIKAIWAKPAYAENWIDKIKESISVLLFQILPAETVTKIKDFAGIIATLGSVLWNFISTSLKWLWDHKDEVVKVITDIVIAFVAFKAAKETISTIRGITTAITSLASPMNLVIAAITLLLTAWKNNWLGIRDVFKPIFDSVFGWLKILFDKIKELSDNFGQDKAKGMINIIEMFGFSEGDATKIYNFLSDTYKKLQEFVSAVKTGDWKTALTSLGIDPQIIENIKTTWESLKATFEPAVNRFIEALKGLPSQILPISNALGGFFDAIGKLKDAAIAFVNTPAVQEGLNLIASAVTTVVKVIMDFGAGMLKTSGSSIASAIDTITQIVNIVTAVIKLGTDLLSWQALGGDKTATEIFQPFLDSIVGALSHVTFDLKTIATNIGESLYTAILQSVDDYFKQHSPTTEEQKKAQSLNTFFLKRTTDDMSKAPASQEDINNGADSIKKVLLNFFGEVWNQLKKKYSFNPVGSWEGFTTWFRDSFLNGIADSLINMDSEEEGSYADIQKKMVIEIRGFLSKVWDNIKKTIKEGPAFELDSGATGPIDWEKIAKSILPNGVPEVNELWLTDPINNLKKFFNDINNKLEQKIGKEDILKIGTKEQWEAIRDKFVKGFSLLGDKIDEAGKNLIKFLEDSIKYAADNLPLAGKEGWDALKESIKKAIEWGKTLFDAGKEVVNGLFEGIKSQGAQFKKDFIDWLFTWIPEPVLKFLGIASPSRMFMWIGRMIVLGLAAGIKGAGEEAIKATTEMVNGVIGAMNAIMDFLNNLSNFSAPGNIRAKLREILDSLEIIMQMFRVVAERVGTAPHVKDFADYASSVLSTIKSVTDTVAAIAALNIPTNLLSILDPIFQVLSYLVQRFRSMTPYLGNEEERAQLIKVVEDLGLVFSAFTEVMTTLSEALDFFDKLNSFAIPDISGKFNMLLAIVRSMVVQLADLLDLLGQDRLAKAVTIGKFLGDLVAPWVTIAELAKTISRLAEIDVTPKIDYMIGIVVLMFNAMQSLVSDLDSGALEKASKVADFVSKIVAPWQQVIDAISAIANYNPSAGIITSGGLWFELDKIIVMLRLLIERMISIYNDISPEDIKKAKFIGEQVAVIVSPWTSLVEALTKIQEYIPQDIYSQTIVLIEQVRSIIQASLDAFSDVDMIAMAQLKEVFELLSPVISAFSSVIDILIKVSESEANGIPFGGSGQYDFVTNVILIIQSMVNAIKDLDLQNLEDAAKKSEHLITIIEPWKTVVETVQAMAGVETMPAIGMVDKLKVFISAFIDGVRSVAEILTPQDAKRFEAAANVIKFVTEPWKIVAETVSSLSSMLYMPDQGIVEKLANIVQQFIDTVRTIANDLTPQDVKRLGDASAVIKAVVEPWKIVVETIKSFYDISYMPEESMVGHLLAMVNVMILAVKSVANGLTPQDTKRITDAAGVIKAVAETWKAVADVVTVLQKLQSLPININKAVDQAVMLILGIQRIIGAIGEKDLKRISETAAIVGAVVGVWKTITETITSLQNATSKPIANVAAKLTDQVVLLVVKLGQIVGYFTPQRLRQISESADMVAKILDPWKNAVEVIAAIAEHTDKVIGPIAERLRGQIIGLAIKIEQIVNRFGSNLLEKIAGAAEFISKILDPWKSAIEAIDAIAGHTDKVIGQSAEKIKSQIIGLIVKVSQIRDRFGPEVLKNVSEVAEFIKSALSVWKDAVEVIDIIAEHTDRVIGPAAERIAGQIRGLMIKMIAVARYFGPDALEQASVAAGFIVQALSVWDAAIKTVDAIAAHTDKVIGPIAERLAGQIQGLTQKLARVVKYIGVGILEETAKGAEFLVKIMEPWQTAISVINAMALWHEIAGTETKFTRFVKIWSNIIEDIARMVRESKNDALPLANKFAEVLGNLSNALKSAVELSLAMPENWQTPDAWDSFIKWVKSIFMDFYAWSNTTTTVIVNGVPVQVPVFSQGGMEIMSLFVETLASLLDTLKLAVELSLAIPANWTTPPKWTDFTNWVKEVFLAFYDWMNSQFTEEQLSLMSVFAQALSDLMEGLKTALELGLALAKGWTTPNWAAFTTWVMDVFNAFYTYMGTFTTEGLNLMSTFADALSTLMNGLKAALDVAMALPKDWVAPDWNDFTKWVMGIFRWFYVWIDGRFTLDGLALMQAFTNALSGLFGGLKAAMEFALALPTGWTAPGSWENFKTWVQTVFTEFYDWVNSWGTPPVPHFGEDELDLIGKFATALGSLFGGLSSALQFVSSLPAMWAIPASWEPFKTWLFTVFEQFYNWANSWGTPPVPHFNGEGLDLIQALGQAMQSLFQGLLAAIQLVAAMPTQWTEITVWNDFYGWVTLVMNSFITWINQNFTQEEGTIAFQMLNSFGQAMQSIFNGLVAALNLFDDLVYWSSPGSPFDTRITNFLEHVYFVITSIRDWVRDNLTPLQMDLIQRFAQALQTIVSSLTAAMDLFRQLADPDNQGAYTASLEFEQRVSALMQAIYGAFHAFHENIVLNAQLEWILHAQQFMTAMNTIFGTLNTALQLFVQLNQNGLPDPELIQAFINAILDLFDQLQEGLEGSAANTQTNSEALAGILGGFPENVNNPENNNLYLEATQQLMNSLIDGLVEVFDVLNLFSIGLGSYFNSLPSLIDPSGILLAAQDIVSAFMYGLAAGALPENLNPVIDAIMTAIVNAFGAASFMAAMWQAGYGAVYQVSLGMRGTGATEAINYAAGVVASYVTTVLGSNSVLGNMWSAGFNLANAVALGLSSATGTQNAYAAISYSANQAVLYAYNTLVSSDTYGLMWWAGFHMDEGIAQGLEYGSSNVIYDAVIALINAIIGGLQSGLQLGSPSRRGMQMGYWLSEGIAIGITSGIGLIDYAIEDMMYAMTGSRYPIFDNGFELHTRKEIDIKVTVDGDHLPPSVLDRIKSELIYAVQLNS